MAKSTCAAPAMMAIEDADGFGGKVATSLSCAIFSQVMRWLQVPQSMYNTQVGDISYKNEFLFDGIHAHDCFSNI